MFWDLYNHYFVEDSPPLIVDPADKVLKRHCGSSGRCAFWAGYDGLITPLYPRRGTSAVASAYRGGAAYRKAVNAGNRAALPEK